MSVAATYAEALYEAAQGAGAADAVAVDLASFVGGLAESPELVGLLESPDISTAAKKAALGQAIGPQNRVLVNFLGVLLDRGRISEVGDIARAYAERVDEAEGRIAVEAITAIPLPDDLRQLIVDKVARESGRTPVLTERVDPDMIGGLILRVGGVMLDASARHHLDALRRTLSTAPMPVGAES